MQSNPTTALIRKATRLFNSEYVSREVNKANRRRWLNARAVLGDGWLCAKPVARKVTV